MKDKGNQLNRLPRAVAEVLWAGAVKIAGLCTQTLQESSSPTSDVDRSYMQGMGWTGQQTAHPVGWVWGARAVETTALCMQAL